ncbi:hypothetical protein TSUD_191060 [Trifolium subterraneum]|uniref:Uncharacterized protein n=1 Tax=Trifolium subterraneum TaxID=3900 RepID=A0A2Z6PKB1_TRISU|nr:hypothetical protein TSUD_191060 [Trifolium subterraneum]
MSDLPGMQKATPMTVDPFEERIAKYRIGTAELATLGRYVIPMLSSGFSDKAIGILFVLAYNLRRPTKGVVEYVFQDHELGLGSLEDMNVFYLSDNLLIRVREPFYIAATTDLDREAM